MERRLAAILSADVVGYSRLMGADEGGTLERLKACRRELVDSAIEEHHGRIIKLMGDGALVEFASVVDAVQCAAVIQRGMSGRDPGLPAEQRIRFRIGINLGDIIVEGDDIYGDGVNIAARLQGIAEPGGIFISGTAFDHVAHKVDVGFSALGEHRLKNIADPVRVYCVLLDPAHTGKVVFSSRARPRGMALLALVGLLIAASATVFAWQWPHKQRASIAVLPFANLSDQTQDYFADGITNNLITDLARLSNLDVISQNSVFTYKGKPHVLEEIRRDLGVRFVVEGSVQRSGDLIRVNAQLIDTSSGDHLWANRFDRSAAEVFAVQDAMGRQIADALGLKLTRSETERIARPPTANLEAYDYYLRAEQAARTGRRSLMLEALGLFDKAEALDGGFAEAFASDARATSFVWRSAYDDVLQSALARKRAYEKASRALALDPELPSPYAVLAIMQAVDRRYEQAIASAQKAVSLGAANAEAHMAVAYVQLVWGNHADAAAAVETALRYDPNPSAIDRYTAGMVFYLQHDYDRAIDSLKRAGYGSQGNGEFVTALAMAYVRVGRIDEARATVAEAERLLGARDSLAAWRIGNAHFRKEDLAFILDALREAGLPEWPFGFQGNEQSRLKGSEIAATVMGKVLRGKTEPAESLAIMQVEMDGKAAFRSATQMMTETVSVKGDLLCEQSENAFGQPDCGPVYRHANPTDETTYAYVNSTKVFYFSAAK
ncbi:adenylate cyclase protein (plasmid) [Rhizobium phaseoli]|uniref:Adenylate cyclase protein n=1 Tax=Rhizobium phaseoli TaxID=396 RepID=A0A192TKT1_9HYPH|nr:MULTISPECIES: adenylate/guanylate cyclase domain-containing protein [Rhizobium]MDH6648413.1 adenylate cyclase [Rhizobium esperanzae]ANL30785.1 adenylate cyclase protein [Rhizobium phaseoli]ANL43209.1 adenylate cyclase protein [Rhizobium phaseoli]ANL56208.1 adenylate cyclase protein [Rhizobium phaseoli]ANL62195.1 adenylate cyclase protein [Rhizobium phaseoli]